MDIPFRMENGSVDAARPQARPVYAPSSELFAQSRGRHQHRAGRFVEPPHDRPEPVRRNPGAGGGIVWKAGVEGRCKPHVIGLAPSARGPSNRAFGHDVDDIGAKGLQRPTRGEARGNGKAYFGIARHRHREELVWRDQFNFISPLHQDPDRRRDAADDAVDLREPRIGGDGYPHAATIVLAALWRSRTISAQSRIDMAPVRSSTSAVQLSTQSPSL